MIFDKIDQPRNMLRSVTTNATKAGAMTRKCSTTLVSSNWAASNCCYRCRYSSFQFVETVPPAVPTKRFASNDSCDNRISDDNVVKIESSKGRSRTQRRRRRFALNSGDDDGSGAQVVPSYKDFLHKFTVVSMYRNYLKCIRSMDGQKDELNSMKSELYYQVKREFQANKNESDKYAIQRTLQEGRRRYQELQHMVPTARKKSAPSPSPSSLQYLEEDSWLNIKDPEDPRGRVGQGWPWETKGDE